MGEMAHRASKSDEMSLNSRTHLVEGHNSYNKLSSDLRKCSERQTDTHTTNKQINVLNYHLKEEKRENKLNPYV